VLSVISVFDMSTIHVLPKFLLIDNLILKFLKIVNSFEDIQYKMCYKGSKYLVCLVSFSVAILNSKALGSGTSGSAVCISVSLTSLTPYTFIFF
jgi:hypothetical protein